MRTTRVHLDGEPFGTVPSRSRLLPGAVSVAVPRAGAGAVTERYSAPEVKPGDRLFGARGRRIGRVDAVFADYLLVRTGVILPVDLYVPRDAVSSSDGKLRVELDRERAYDAWHRPLKRAPHEER